MNNAKQVRQIRILGILLLGVLATALAVFVIGPRFTDPSVVQGQAISTINEKAILDVRYLVLGQKASSLDAAKAELDAVGRKYLSNRTQFPLLSSQIYGAANKVGIPYNKVFEPAIDIKTVAAPGEEDASAGGPGGVIPVTIKFSAEGSLPTLIAFLKSLGDMEYTVVVEAAQIVVPASPNGASVPGGTYTINITAKAFMLPPVDLAGGQTSAPEETPAVTPSN
jgi:hypothetical protein